MPHVAQQTRTPNSSRISHTKAETIEQIHVCTSWSRRPLNVREIKCLAPNAVTILRTCALLHKIHAHTATVNGSMKSLTIRRARLVSKREQHSQQDSTSHKKTKPAGRQRNAITIQQMFTPNHGKVVSSTLSLERLRTTARHQPSAACGRGDWMAVAILPTSLSSRRSNAVRQRLSQAPAETVPLHAAPSGVERKLPPVHNVRTVGSRRVNSDGKRWEGVRSYCV